MTPKEIEAAARHLLADPDWLRRRLGDNNRDAADYILLCARVALEVAEAPTYVDPAGRVMADDLIRRPTGESG